MAEMNYNVHKYIVINTRVLNTHKHKGTKNVYPFLRKEKKIWIKILFRCHKSYLNLIF